MTDEVVTVGAGALYREVVARMKRHAVNALPVVDRCNAVVDRCNALVDIVSSADLLLKDVQAREGRPAPGRPSPTAGPGQGGRDDGPR